MRRIDLIGASIYILIMLAILIFSGLTWEELK